MNPKIKIVWLIAIFSLNPVLAFATGDSASIISSGVGVTPQSAGGGGGLQIASALPEAVKGHRTTTAPGGSVTLAGPAPFYFPVSYNYPGWRAVFNQNGTVTFYLNHHIRNNAYVLIYRWAGAYTLYPAGVSGSGYMFCSTALPYIGKICVTAGYTNITAQVAYGAYSPGYIQSYWGGVWRTASGTQSTVWLD